MANEEVAGNSHDEHSLPPIRQEHFNGAHQDVLAGGLTQLSVPQDQLPTGVKSVSELDPEARDQLEGAVRAKQELDALDYIAKLGEVIDRQRPVEGPLADIEAQEYPK